MLVNRYRRDVSVSGRGLRGLRSVRTAAVISGARAKQYSVCLSQAEAMWAAAARVSTVASPILRYYALLQAVWAVIAASNLSNADWRPRASHGVEVDVRQRSGVLDLADVTVSALQSGAAITLASALGTPLLARSATLESLIAALPTQPLVVTGGSVPTALTVEVNAADWEIMLMGIGEHLEGDELASVMGLIESYPTFAKLPQPTRVHLDPPEAAERRAYLNWGRNSPVRSVADLPDFVDIWRVDGSGHGRGEALILPAVGGNSSAQHPLLTWFLVLHAFSILARYHPSAWQRLLDVDSSPKAVLLEQLIDTDSADALVFVEEAIEEFRHLSRGFGDGDGPPEAPNAMQHDGG